MQPSLTINESHRESVTHQMTETSTQLPLEEMMFPYISSSLEPRDGLPPSHSGPLTHHRQLKRAEEE